ncbi:UNVERIFIED_CONTAM: Retrovirus-related Pol polyprotein from transposon TNT 1-94 [Sesamum radiatum]|uniref:Retrovirus-related Pol polyprotein from transposon TNT 1-94 n=1 Tax=Sesamum radiatum TaxID=300843 RepID=A0AAW2WKJ9_SESRA
MREEMKSLKDNKTWVLVPKPKNTSIVDSKWIFKLKNENDSLRYKARLVAKGFTQKEGIDNTEIFSPVVKYTTVRIILALTAHFDWELKQMDVKTAFLHGDSDENIYMAQPCGFIDNKNPEHLSKDQSPKSDSEKKLMEKVPYSNAIGSVMYLMVCTRPDIAYAVSCLSRYMSNAGPPHWEALKWLLRYLSGSTNTEYIAITEAFKEAMWLEGPGPRWRMKNIWPMTNDMVGPYPAQELGRPTQPNDPIHQADPLPEPVRSLGVTLGELYAVVEQPVLGFQPYRGCVTRISGSGHSEPFPVFEPTVYVIVEIGNRSTEGLYPTDQIAPPDFVPAVYFYQPDAKFSNLGKSNNLKKSLSQVLSRFYPLAGRLVDNLYVDCNDQGATYIEAVANCNLSQVITNPVTNNITKFLPYKVDDVQDIGMAVQAANTWAAVARNGNYDDVPEPKFEGAKIFPPRDALRFNPSTDTREELITKIFIFPDSKISASRKGTPAGPRSSCSGHQAGWRPCQLLYGPDSYPPRE